MIQNTRNALIVTTGKNQLPGKETTMSNEERVLRKGDSTVGYPLSPRPNSLYQSVLSIPGVEGPWTDGTLDTGYMRHSVEFGRRWIEEQSGHEWPTLIIPSAMRHSLWPIAMPKNYGRMKVHCPEPGEKFHATAVPMLVAPSVERPLWKVVFKDAIAETEPPKPRVSDDPAKESGLCIGGPLDGRYFSGHPDGYRTYSKLMGKTAYVFFVHDSLPGADEAMHILRDHYSKTKKAEVPPKTCGQCGWLVNVSCNNAGKCSNIVVEHGTRWAGAVACKDFSPNPTPKEAAEFIASTSTKERHVTIPWPDTRYSAGATGTWDVSTTCRADIERSVRTGIAWIQDNGGPQHAEFIIPSKLARAIGSSCEMLDYMKQRCTPDQTWRGLPKEFHGIPVRVRDDFTNPAVVAPTIDNANYWRYDFPDCVT